MRAPGLSVRQAWVALAAVCLALPSARAEEPSSETIFDITRSEFVEPNLGAKIDRALTKYESYGFSGSIFVGYGGLVALHKGYGLADRDGRIPISVDTAFPIGDLTQQFTAAAILRLESQGRLAADDPVSKYLGPMPGEKGRATIRHLLTHRAGLVAEEESVLRADREEFLQAVREAPIEFAPGSRHRPSRVDYILLAAIIEEASGVSYEEYLRGEIFLTAGMSATRFSTDPDPQAFPTAVGHVGGQSVLPWLGRIFLPQRTISLFSGRIRGRADRLRPADTEPYDWTARGHTGILSTTGDMFRWELAIRGKKILPPLGWETIVSAAREGEAYGWRVEKTRRGTDRFRSVGVASGYEGLHLRYARYLRYVDKDLVIIILTNNDMGWPRGVQGSLEEIVYGEDFSTPFAILAALAVLFLLGGATRSTVREPSRRRRSPPFWRRR